MHLRSKVAKMSPSCALSGWPFLCLHERTREMLKRFSANLIWGSSVKFVSISQLWLTSGNDNGHFCSQLERSMFQTRVVEKNWKHFVLSTLIHKSYHSFSVSFCNLVSIGLILIRFYIGGPCLSIQPIVFCSWESIEHQHSHIENIEVVTADTPNSYTMHTLPNLSSALYHMISCLTGAMWHRRCS
jgi:hypothetical protein